MKKRKFKTSIIKTIILGIVLLICITAGGSAAIGYAEFSTVIEDQYRHHANMTANTVSKFINGDTLDQYLETKQKDEEYIRTENVLQTIADNADCAVIYVAKVDKEAQKRIYIYDVVGKDYPLDIFELGYEYSVGDNFLSGYESLEQGSQLKNFMYGSSGTLGAYTTTIAPIYNSDGEIAGICGVVKTMSLLKESRASFLRSVLALAIVLALVVGSNSIYTMRKRIVIPLRMIVDETERFANESQDERGNLSEKLQVSNEIGELAEAIDKMEESVVSNVRELLTVTAEKNRIGAELDIATQIQERTLPRMTESFPGREEIDVYAVMDPAKAVGGDFYDCFFIDENHFAMIIADVSGKGVPAALFMMVSKVLLKTVAMANSDPGTILENVNQKLCEDNQSDMFVTVWLGILDLRTGLIQASSAGHEYPILKEGADGFHMLKDRHGFVLGGMDGARYKTYSIQLNKGDCIFLYTDGLPEAINSEEEQFGMERMIASLNRQDNTDPENLIGKILSDAGDFVGDAEQFDDTTILCLRYNGSFDDCSKE